MKKSELYSLLWEACNKLRGGVEPSRYKDYVLVLLFFKYVSDRYKGQPFAEFTVSQGASFDDLIAAKGRSDIGERVDKILQKFLEDNRLQGALPDVSFNNREELGSGKELVDRVTGLIGVFQNPAIDFKNNRASGDDIIGDNLGFLRLSFRCSFAGLDRENISFNVFFSSTESWVIFISKFLQNKRSSPLI